MDASKAITAWSDPYALLKEANAFHATGDGSVADSDSAVETSIRQAHELVSPDLYVIEHLKKAGVESDLIKLFGEKFHEKLAALIFLTKLKLMDIEHGTLQSRDLEDARRDLSTYVEILFRVQAVDALSIFYDFASAQRDSRVPWLWHNVCTRSLYLMALLAECRAKVLAFMEERPGACRVLEDLLLTTKPEVAGALRSLLNDIRRSRTEGGIKPVGDTPQYVALAKEYENKAPVNSIAAGMEMGRASGMSSLLTAQDRIQQAATSNDVPALVDWISRGSAAAMRTALNSAMAVMPLQQYVELLDQVVQSGTVEPPRMTTIIMELGTINQNSQTHGGLPFVNRVLCSIGTSSNEKYIGVAKICVHQLSVVRAMHELQMILDRGLLPVAEEVVHILREHHHLPMVESILNQRPELMTAYRTAHREMVELQNLLEAAYSCPSLDLAAVYLTQLKARKAFTELKQLTLAKKNVSTLAQQYLTELQKETPWILTQ